jgi:two-component system, OmpR family, sensor histidine kinase KdpD
MVGPHPFGPRADPQPRREDFMKIAPRIYAVPMATARAATLRPTPPPRWVGVLVALVLVAISTGLIFPLKTVAPVVSLGVVYLIAVFVISTVWGTWLGILTALASAAAFNWFHIPPTGRFTIAEGENWVALAAFLAVAVAASTIAEIARSRAIEAEERRQEADLAAEATRLLLGGARPEDGLGVIAERVASVLELPSAAIELGAVPSRDRREVFPLLADGLPVGTLILPAGLSDRVRARVTERIVPALASILAAALERDRLQAEVVETAALRQSDVVKTALLRTVSHDLRSPLTAIVAAGEALRSPTLSQEDRDELAATVVEEGSRLSQLIEKLLDLSRLQAGADAPRPDLVALDELLRATAENLPGDPARFQLAVGELPPIHADAAQLERVFANLFENAARYSPGQPVSVRARALHNRIMVRVVDHGPGISPADQQRVFEPFYRGSAVNGHHRGSGIGLAIVKGLVEANGGRVWVESLPGQGACFVVELPVERDQEPAPA